MKLRFNLAFDGNPWPGPLGKRDAAWGEAWVGPLGLLGQLETQLGLSGLWLGSAERDTELIQAVRTAPGFWERSAEVDPISTARTLRRWRDHLVLHGWEPERADRRRGDRISSLARVTRGVSAGFPDRLRQVIGELGPDRLDLEELVLTAQPRTGLPALWQRALNALEGAGVRVGAESVDPAERAADTDLAQCFDRGYRPVSDGTLQLLRAAGPQAAAEVAAKWLAGIADQGELAGTVLIGGDALLDTALQARGVPTTGAPSVGDGDPLLAVLPLVVRLGWGSTDPRTALDLLLLPELPLASGLAAGLAEALCELPAVGSYRWEKIRSRYLEACDEEARKRLEGWLELLFRTDATGEVYPTSAMMRRIRRIERWARGRAANDELGRFEALADACVALRRNLGGTGMESLSEPQLDRLLNESTGSSGERWQAQVGLHRMGGPDSLVGAVDHVLWWGFTRDAAAMPQRPLLSEAERSMLEEQGAVLPDPGAEARRTRDGWLRPFALTRAQLCLVAPRLDAAGEPAFPHPVWDEVVGCLGGRAVQRMAVDMPVGVVADRDLPTLPLPQPAPVWQPELAAPLAAPERLSPSATGPFVGCPVRYVLEKDVGLGAELPAEMPSGTLLAGRYAHRLFELLLSDYVGRPLPDPEELGLRAGEVFDREAPGLVGAWFQPGHERDRAVARAGFVGAAAALARFVGPGRARVAAVEQWLERQSRGYRIGGLADLVLSTPGAIIDYKWWGKGRLKGALSAGTAYQLAAYSWASASGRSPLPDVAYFFIDRPELATTASDTFAEAFVIDGPSPDDTMAALRRALLPALEERTAGRLACGGTPEDPESLVEADFVDEEGRMWLAPPCGFCDFAELCARGNVR